jgi:hypothetical protein
MVNETACVAYYDIGGMAAVRSVALRIKTGWYVEAGELYVVESLMLSHERI